MKHWRLERDAENIAWLRFDQADSRVNTLSSDTLAELEEALDMLEADLPQGVVLVSGKGSGFVAGGNVKEFARLRDAAEAARLIGEAQALFARLEGLTCPTLAAIHGHCMGGGLELALACDYRVATDHPQTRLGFPEIRLGIFPGFGGTVRPLARTGHVEALRMILTARTVSGRAAHRSGLVDDCVPRRQLESAARHILHRRPRHRRPALWQRAAGWPGARPLVAYALRRLAAARARPDHYPAPQALIRHWRQHAGRPQAMLAAEVETVARLLTRQPARNLVRVFLLQDRLKGLAAPDQSPPRHLHVIGAGVMGGDIAAWAALSGLSVSLQDQGTEPLARAVERAQDLFQHKLKAPREVRAALDRLIPDPAGNGVAQADVVIEAIVEDAGAKQALFRELWPRLQPRAVVATNTSSIPLEELAAELPEPGRLVGLHFFNPVARMPLLEVVRGTGTDARIVNRALAFARAIDKLPLPVASSPGFLVNRVLMPYLLEAVTLLEEGATAAAVDRAALDFGMPMGPVELADSVGLDVCLAVARRLGEATGIAPPEALQRHVSAGELGRKTGTGFYRWKGRKPIRRRGHRVTDSHRERLMLRFLNEAVACLREGVVADADLLDAGMVFGTGFAPFRGGPMHYIQAEGPASLRGRLQRLEATEGARFAPDPGWSSGLLEGGGP